MRDDDFYLPKHHVAELRELLTQTIPSRLDDLAITLTCQDRITRPGLTRGRCGRLDGNVPLNLDAAAAEHELRAALVGAVRLVCEHRGQDYDGPADNLGLCAWLRRNLVALALTPGAPDVHADITAAAKQARQVVDLPGEDDIVIDRARVHAANRQIVTADAMDQLGRRLGQHGLTASRVRGLRKHGHLRPCSTDPDTGAHFYRLGEVLDAHHRVQRRHA